MRGKKYTYLDLKRRYDRLSHENTMRLRKKETPEAYEFAAKREEWIGRAFFADCRRYLTKYDI